MIALGVAEAARDSFVRYVAHEVAPHGITADVVAPSTAEDTAVSGRLSDEGTAELAAEPETAVAPWFTVDRQVDLAAADEGLGAVARMRRGRSG